MNISSFIVLNLDLMLQKQYCKSFANYLQAYRDLNLNLRAFFISSITDTYLVKLYLENK